MAVGLDGIADNYFLVHFVLANVRNRHDGRPRNDYTTNIRHDLNDITVKAKVDVEVLQDAFEEIKDLEEENFDDTNGH